MRDFEKDLNDWIDECNRIDKKYESINEKNLKEIFEKDNIAISAYFKSKADVVEQKYMFALRELCRYKELYGRLILDNSYQPEPKHFSDMQDELHKAIDEYIENNKKEEDS